MDTAGVRVIRAGRVGEVPESKGAKRRVRAVGWTMVSAQTIAETIQNLENLRLDMDQEDRYVVAALKACHNSK